MPNLIPNMLSQQTEPMLVQSLDYNRIYEKVEHLKAVDYPEFHHWFWHKVVPGYENNTRGIFVRADGNRITGIAIAKRGLERKLCTLWVDEAFRDRGLAGSLADEAFNWLQTRKPLFSVSKKKLNEFRGLLRSWDFGSGVQYEGYYHQSATEIVFNGSLRPDWNS